MNDFIPLILIALVLTLIFIVFTGFSSERADSARPSAGDDEGGGDRHPEYEPEDENAPEPSPEDFGISGKQIYGEDTLGNLFKRTWRYFDTQDSAGKVVLGARNYQFDISYFHQEETIIDTGMNVSIESLAQALFESGFERVDFVSKPRQFAVRGGIVDIYIRKGDAPYRLNFFGNTVESIVKFDINTQRPVQDCGIMVIELLKYIEVEYYKVIEGSGKGDSFVEAINLTELTRNPVYQFIGTNAQKECQEYIMNVFGLSDDDNAYFTMNEVIGSDRNSL